VGLVFGPLLDPTADQFHLLRRQRAVRRRRGHPGQPVLGADSLVEAALSRPSGDNDPVTASVGKDSIGPVKPQIGLALLFVRPVAGEAVVGQDWADLAVEIDAFGLGCLLRREPQSRAGDHEQCVKQPS